MYKTFLKIPSTTIFMARKLDVTIIKINIVLHNTKAVIKNGLNTLTKHITHIGSNELILATFPIPKNANNK